MTPNDEFSDLNSRSTYGSHCVTFRKTKEANGYFSNMAGGYPLKVPVGSQDYEHLTVKSSEHLYQALKFPYDQPLQVRILAENSPFWAKKVASQNSASQVDNWFDCNIAIMHWVLMLKFSQYEELAEYLDETGTKPIIEDLGDRNPDLWGAKWDGEQWLGVNMLGKLLMELRDNGDHKRKVLPLYEYLYNSGYDSSFTLTGCMV